MLLASGFFMASSAAKADVTLRYKFNDGEQLHYEMEQKMNMEINAAGQNTRIATEQTIDMTWKILSVDKDGTAKMTQKIDRVRLMMDGLPTGKLEFDSKEGKDIDGPVGQAITPILKALAGAEFDVTMDAQGKITNFKIPPDLAEAFKNRPAGAGGAGGDLFSAEGLKHMVGQGSMVFPSQPIAKGKTWEQQFDMKLPTGGKMKMVNELTYGGPATANGKKFEKIMMKPKMTLEAGENAAIQMELKDQDSKGEANFDNEAGRLDNMNMTQIMNMAITVNGMTLDQKTEGKVTMKLVDKSKQGK
jgi:hypothetical protein